MNFVTMAEQKTEDGSSMKEGGELEKEKQKKNVDLELLSCLLQPMSIGVDPDYIGTRRLLLYRKAEAAVLRRKDWRCNGKGYVAFRNFIRRPRNWESSRLPSLQSTPGNSGRWVPPPSSLSLLHEVESWSSSKVCSEHSRPSSEIFFFCVGPAMVCSLQARREGLDHLLWNFRFAYPLELVFLGPLGKFWLATKAVL